MKFSYAWLKELLPMLPPPKETAALLTLHAFEVGDLRREAGDWVLDVDILPNRMADASSHHGLARELRAILLVQQRGRKNASLRFPQVRLSERLGGRVGDILRVTVKDRRRCAFYGARVVTGVRVGPSPAWLQRRLRVLGLEPINNIVDATNYVMLETGQPLHAFDLDAIAPERRGALRKHLIVRKARLREKIVTLDGEARILDSSVTVIADERRALAIAGMKGGEDASIGVKTVSVALEAALFAPEYIYRASRRFGIATDASRRFEVRRSPESVVPALERAAAFIATMGGGRIAQGAVTVGSAKVSERRAPFHPERIRELLGVSVSETEARSALEAIGCAIATKKGRGANGRGWWIVTPPSVRFDLEREEDFVEEVGRLLGYQRVAQRTPLALLAPALAPEAHRWAERARDVLAAQGYHETMRMSFVNEALMREWGFGRLPLVMLENPQSRDLEALRPALLPRLLSQAQQERRANAETRLFEVGAVFTPAGVNKISERVALSAVLAREKGVREHTSQLLRSVFYELKGACQDLVEHFGLTDIAWQPLDRHLNPAGTRGKKEPYSPFSRWARLDLWHPGKSALLFVDGRPAGVVGEPRPRFLEAHRMRGAVAAAEIDFTALALAASEEHEYRPASRYPELIRDIAVLVPQQVLADEVGKEIAREGKALVRDVDLFDYYEGPEVPAGEKNLAFRIVYQAQDRTLTDGEADELHKRIERMLAQHGWTVR